MARAQAAGWTQMADPPALTAREWNVASLVGIVLIVAALLQAISFGDFTNWLNSIGLGSENIWAVGIIVAEVWAAIGFFKLPLMNGFRLLSSLLALAVAGFWFVQNLRLVSEGASGNLTSSGFFGGLLEQSPGWWTVIEVTVFLMLVVYSLRLTSGWSKAN